MGYVLEGSVGINFESTEGVLVVQSLTPGLAAENAGIKVGDRVFSIAGQKVGRAPEAVKILKEDTTWSYRNARGGPGDSVVAVIEVSV